MKEIIFLKIKNTELFVEMKRGIEKIRYLSIDEEWRLLKR